MQMCIFLCMGGNSTTWMNTAVLVTCMRNFPKSRGPVSGILKGYVGLSTAIFTDICAALFSSDPSTFLLMLAVVPTVICLVAAVFLCETAPEEEKRETQLLNAFNVMAIVLASYLLAFDISGSHGHVLSVAFAIGLVVLLALPLGVPFYLGMPESKPNSDIEQAIKQPLIAPPTRLEDSVTLTETVAQGSVQEKRQPLIGEDHTVLEMMKTVDFWILFVSFLCGVGTGMCFMNNMGQMGLALGYVDVSIFVSLTSIWGFFGRIISGLVSEHYIWYAQLFSFTSV